MSDVLKRLLCLVLALVVVFSFAGCRKSPVLEQKVYTQDAETDPDQQEMDNQEDHTQEDSTLPPRTTKQEASQQADQTKVSANRPRTNPQTRPNTNTQGQNTQAPTQKPNNEQSNTNKGSGEVPGVSENPSSPINKIERDAVNRHDPVENVATVVAAGEAGLFVEMLGGPNRLLGSSQSFKENYFAGKFSDYDNVRGFWDGNGDAPMGDAQFRQLLDVNPEAVFYIVSGKPNVVTFSEDQLLELNQKGILTQELAPFNTTHNIRTNVTLIGKALGSKVPNTPDANKRASDYIDWMDRIISGKESQTFSGINKWNLDNDGDFKSAQSEGSYSDVGQYTILINGWDPDAQTDLEQGVAYAHTGYSARTSPVSYYLSIGGAANTAVMVSDSLIRDIPVIPRYQTTVYGNVNGGSIGSDYQVKTKSMTNFDGRYIGEPGFETIIIDSQSRTMNSQDVRNTMEQSEAWKYREDLPYGTFSNVHGEYKKIINPHGLGSWTSGSPESPFEVLWAEEVFIHGQDEDGAFSAIREQVRAFYSDNYDIALTDDDLDYIKMGLYR